MVYQKKFKKNAYKYILYLIPCNVSLQKSAIYSVSLTVSEFCLHGVVLLSHYYFMTNKAEKGPGIDSKC